MTKHDYSLEYSNIITNLNDLKHGNYYEKTGSGSSVKNIAENIEKELNNLLEAIAKKQPGMKDTLFQSNIERPAQGVFLLPSKGGDHH